MTSRACAPRRCTKRGARSAALAAGVLAVAPFAPRMVARADDERPAARSSSLSWIRLEGADACVATQPLARAVEARLGRPVFVSAAQAEVSIEGKIEPRRTGAGFRATLVLRDARGATLGTREIDGDGKPCEAMTERLALVIALLIDPNALAARAAPDAGVPPPEAGPVPDAGADAGPLLQADAAIEAAPAPATTASPPPKESLRFQGGAFVASVVGLLPHPGAGIGAGAILHPPRFVALEAYGVAYNDSIARGREADVTVSYLHVAGSLCPGAYSGDLGFHLCVGQEIGVLRKRAGGKAPNEDTLPAWNFTLGARLILPVVKPFALRLALRGLVPLFRERLSYTRQDGSVEEVFRAFAVGADGEVGFGVFFP